MIDKILGVVLAVCIVAMVVISTVATILSGTQLLPYCIAVAVVMPTVLFTLMIRLTKGLRE